MDMDDSCLDEPIPRYKKILCFLTLYTSFFLIIFFFGYWVFWETERSFIGRHDALQNEFTGLVYSGQYWRRFIRSILAGNPQFLMFDFTISLGNNVFQGAMGGLLDIFGLISTLIPTRHVEKYYEFLVIFRPYLAGLTFSILCVYAKQKKWAILIGALLYSFSGYVLFVGTRHPSFIMAMIYAPIFFIGVDMVLRKKRPYLLIITTFIVALTGFYLLYKITIFLVVYTIIRIHHLHERKFWRNLFPSGIKVAFCYLLGLMMSSVVFIPSILGLFSSSERAAVWPSNLWFTNFQAYVSRFVNSISVTFAWDSISMAAIIMLAIAALIVKKTDTRDKYYLLSFLAFAFLVLVIPFGGFIMNGFGYASGRWAFLLTLIISFITVYALPRILDGGRRELVAISTIVVLYGYIVIFNDANRHIYSLLAFGMLTLTFASILVGKGLKAPKGVSVLLLTTIVSINLIANTYFMYSDKLGNYIEDFMPRNTTLAAYNALPTLPDEIRASDNSFYRLDMQFNYYANSSRIQNYNSLNVYSNQINGLISEGFIDFDVFPIRFSFCLRGGFDGRTVLNALSSVKYYTRHRGNQSTTVPFGYAHYLDSERQETYINNYYLPIGYTYDKSISYEEFDLLEHGVAKQEAMMQAVVVYGVFANEQSANLHFSSKDIAFTVEEDGLIWEDGILSIEHDYASFAVSFDGIPNSETYVLLTGFDSGTVFETRIAFSTPDVSKVENVPLSRSIMSFGRTNHLVNIGFSEEPQTTVTIAFERKGTYTLDDIQVFCYPMESYPDQVLALKTDHLENVVIESTKVSGDISLQEDKFLVFSIPYCDGWSAKVNGQPAELLRANIMYMALQLDAGEHEIELSFFPPGLIIGAVTSIIGLVVFTGLIVYYQIIKHKKLKHCN